MEEEVEETGCELLGEGRDRERKRVRENAEEGKQKTAPSKGHHSPCT